MNSYEMNSHDDCETAQRIAIMAAKARFGNFKRKGFYLSLSLIFVAIVAGCSSVERSRSLGNPNISANTIALQVCSNCHGVQGISENPNFPNLAAQSQLYLVEQLKSFKSHNRSDPAGFEYMWGISSRLTDEQISGLAAYYSSQRPAPGNHEIQNYSKTAKRFLNMALPQTARLPVPDVTEPKVRVFNSSRVWRVSTPTISLNN